MPSAHRILFVDDDPKLLSGIRRLLGFDYQTQTALGGAEAIELIKTDGPFAVVVSDMRMPGMEGAAVLEKISQLAPNTVRIMLTGNVDQATAVSAVNEGRVFRFLNKPIDPDSLKQTLDEAIRQYELVSARKDLLEKTLAGSMRLLTDMLSMADPMMFGRSQEIRDLAKALCVSAGYADCWHIEVAAMMSSLGCIALPPDVAAKYRARAPLSNGEESLVDSVPRVGYDLLRKIPHLEKVAEAVLFQNARFDGSGAEDGDPVGAAIPFGGRILRLMQDLQQLLEEGLDNATALRTLQRRKGIYDPAILDDATLCFGEDLLSMSKMKHSSVSARCLRIGHMVACDVCTKDGAVLLPMGSTVTPMALEMIKGYLRVEAVLEPIEVYEDRAA